MLTFLHAADFHLDSPFQSLSPQQGAERRQEQRELLARLAEAAAEHHADLLFLAGDLFDGQRAKPETLRVLYHTLEDLEAEVFLSPGNHDPWTPGSPYGRLTWPDHVHIFSTRSPERIVLPHLDAVVYGSAFSSPTRTDGPLEGFRASAEDRRMASFGCFHGELTNGKSRYGPVTAVQIAASGLTYLALGHSHTASGLQRAGRTWYAWPGCPEGRGFDETGDKGVYLGVLEGDRVRLDFLPLAKRRYLTPSLDVTGVDPAQALRDLLARSSPQDIVRVILTGERDEDAPPDLDALTEQAAAFFYSADMVDRTVLSRDLWARMEEDTLTGLFLQTMRRRLDEAPEEERPLLERAIRFGLAALEGREEPK